LALRSRNALAMTETELKLMAAAPPEGPHYTHEDKETP
jgi:hypothetical protein